MAEENISLGSASSRHAASVHQYSRNVRWMKILLPVGALLLIVLIFLSGRGREVVADAETAASAAALGAGLQVENPRFAGVTDDGQPFVVTAKSAVPDGATPDRVELEQPSGEIRLTDGQSVTVRSETGELFRKDERMTLKGSVVLETSDGYRIQTQHVDLDFNDRIATTGEAVTATGPQGSLRADRARIEAGTGRGTAVLRFDGNVLLTFQPEVSD